MRLNNLFRAVAFFAIASSLNAVGQTTISVDGRHESTPARQQAEKWVEGRQWDNGWTVNPDKTVDCLEFATQYKLNKPLWDKLFKFLADNDPKSLKPGKIVLEDGRLWVVVQEYTPATEEEMQIESHKRMIDLQYTFEGNEKMGLASDVKVKTEYSQANDIGFYTTDKPVSYVPAAPDRFFLYFPTDMHKPSVRTKDNPGVSRKIVGKIEYAHTGLEGKTLCVLGDSYVRNHRRPYDETWHAKVAERLKMNYVNFGRNGSSIAFDRTKDGFGPAMTKRYLEMPDSADVILVIAGHNDADYLRKHSEVSLDDFTGGLDSLCSGLREKYRGKPIGFVTPWGVDRQWFSEVIAQIKKTCGKYDIPVFDAATMSGIDVNDPGFRAKYFQKDTDTAHLNNDGHDLMVDKGETFLLEIVK